MLAKIAASVDILSGGRLILGVGAGWYEREHIEFGVPFLTMKERLDRLEDGIKTIRATWEKSNPKPPRNTIPLLMGGLGEKRALPIVAREAAEWNMTRLDIDLYKQKRQVLDDCCRAIGRDPATIRQSVMTSYIIGRSQNDLLERAAQVREIVPRFKDMNPDQVLEETRKTWFVGTPEEVAEQISGAAALGIDLFMLQHFLLDDRDGLKLLGEEVIPAVAGG
jgi:alkanesulfonate monooxygenase SsuD/methylene tetrahydromethanopterin reductase-like flavin-dependent oxidoreductase (luciferase family)